MTTKLIVPPAALAVSMDLARASARVDGTDLDGEIELAVKSATRTAEHLTGRSFINQTWMVTLDHFPDSIRLDHPPIVQVDHVNFYDTNGVLQTLDPQDYMVDKASEPGFIVPAPGRAWPATAAHINAVEVQYVAGYGPTHAAVPPEAQDFILVRVQEKLLEKEESPHAERLLDGLKVF
jgi:uncharacterized phiE125 gp8 family phage protein